MYSLQAEGMRRAFPPPQVPLKSSAANLGNVRILGSVTTLKVQRPSYLKVFNLSFTFMSPMHIQSV